MPAATGHDGKGKSYGGIVTLYEIRFNPIFHRWEVFHTIRSQIRAGERQPVFVADSLIVAAEYIRRCKS